MEKLRLAFFCSSPRPLRVWLLNSPPPNRSDRSVYNPIIFLFTSAAFLYEVPSKIIILLSIFYGTISVVAVVGNFLVIWIVTTSRRMQNVTNCFIANLALADIVIGLFAIPFQVGCLNNTYLYLYTLCSLYTLPICDPAPHSKKRVQIRPRTRFPRVKLYCFRLVRVTPPLNPTDPPCSMR